MDAAASRSIRVFVSSTFRDMVAERDRLARFTFPSIRHACEERAVAFTEVDLRWGITDEQASEGKVLSICLAEIDGARPFFVCVLGDRYGWVPDTIDPDLLEREPWLAEHLERSVTELEIVHGVLRDPDMGGRALFYFRDAKAPSTPNGSYAAESEDATRRLSDLKERILAAGFTPRTFSTPVELDELVRADLFAALDELYPPDANPDPLERERLPHDILAAELADGFMPRPVLSDALDAHARSDVHPLLVTGESGSGKSALLAHWTRSRASTDPDGLVVTHFCGASAEAAEWTSVCRRLMSELAASTGIELAAPAEGGLLRAAFVSALNRFAAERPFTMVIDGVDQLADTDSALDLGWLPHVMPQGCRLVLSAASGTRPQIESVRRGWSCLEIGALEDVERAGILATLLARRRKKLPAETSERICAAEASKNPLFLSVLVDELSVVGSHAMLEENVTHLLTAPRVDDLLVLVLARFERDYNERSALVKDSMRAIWAARYGISESELAGVLGQPSDPVPLALLAPILHACGRQLTSRSGLITFSHAVMRFAVRDRYLAEDGSEVDAHRVLAEWFTAQPRYAGRTLDELPWQLMRAGETTALAALLADARVTERLNDRAMFDLLRYWAKLIEAGVSPSESYAQAIADSQTTVRALHAIGLTLHRLCQFDGANLAYAAVGDEARADEHIGGRQASLGSQAVVLMDRGELDRAMVLLVDQERICREIDHMAGLQGSLGSQALIHKTRGELDRAMVLLADQERICRRIGHRVGLMTSLANQAQIHKARGELDRAMALLVDQERICRELGNMTGLSRLLGAQGQILRARGELDRAMELHAQEELICRDLGDMSGLAASFGNQARIHTDRGEFDRALELRSEEERICRALGDMAELQGSLGNQAVIHMRRGDLDRAMELAADQERICRKLGHKAGLQMSLANQAWVRKARA